MTFRLKIWIKKVLVFFYNRNMKSTNVLYTTTLVYLSAKQSTIHWKPHLLQSCVTCVLTSFCWYCWEFWDQATSAKGRGLVGHNDCIGLESLDLWSVRMWLWLSAVLSQWLSRPEMTP